MSEQSPYDQLGVTEEASFDEIQSARNHLVAQYPDDNQQVARIEAAYDAVLMHRLKLRQEGRIKVPERIRFPERTTPPPTEPQQLPVSRLPEWMQKVIDRPSAQDVLWPALVGVGLAVATVFSPPGVVGLNFILLGSTASCMYFLNRKEGRFGRSFFLAIASLIVGLLIGSILSSILTSAKLPLALDANAIATLSALLVHWLVSAFIK
jgi:hypothetical protein